MSTILITKFKNKAEASRAVEILKEKGFSFESSIEEIEDVYLSRLIDEGMKEEGEVPNEEFDKFLEQKISEADK
jgi:hypothetical protein